MAKKAVKKFRKGEYIVYPTHGVGRVNSIETETYAGTELDLYVINFEKEKMTLRVPIQKVEQLNLRSLSSPEKMKSAFTTLQGKARVKRTMWSRRAQEYETKINSGDLISISEVVRDLYRSDAQPEQSYSERQLYEAALDRMSRELAAVNKLTNTEAIKLIEANLAKSPHRQKAEAAEEEDGEKGDGSQAAA